MTLFLHFNAGVLAFHVYTCINACSTVYIWYHFYATFCYPEHMHIYFYLITNENITRRCTLKKNLITCPITCSIYYS